MFPTRSNNKHVDAAVRTVKRVFIPEDKQEPVQQLTPPPLVEGKKNIGSGEDANAYA